MLSDKDMIVNTYISVPKEMSGLNCAAFVAGIVEAILTGADFVCCTDLYLCMGCIQGIQRFAMFTRKS